jgi:glutamine amidotransferase
MKVGVIDYGVGNLGSVLRAIQELSYNAILIKRATEIHTADCLILPGVGNFSDCMNLLKAGDWTTAINDAICCYDRSLLGVCLGMQLLADNSSEGSVSGFTNGLGFIPGQVRHLSSLGCTLRLPHVGWNNVKCSKKQDCLFNGIADGTDFYFVHSYAFTSTDEAHVIATTQYGIDFPVAVRNGQVWGTQFHPEKSSRAGIRLLRNFLMEH